MKHYKQLIYHIANSICDGGIVAISECLKNNNTLQKLNMSHNLVSYKGIGKALQLNTTLKILDVSYNNISNDRTVAINEYLRNNTLQKLNIR